MFNVSVIYTLVIRLSYRLRRWREKLMFFTHAICRKTAFYDRNKNELQVANKTNYLYWMQ